MVNVEQIIERTATSYSLSAIQSKYIYTLNKYTVDKNEYKLCISEEKEGKVVVEFNKIITCNSETANFVIQLLYNNCVAPIHLNDILEDLGL